MNTMKNTQKPQTRYCSLNDLLARFDPEKHKHELLMDDEPMGQETI